MTRQKLFQSYCSFGHDKLCFLFSSELREFGWCGFTDMTNFQMWFFCVEC